MPCIKMCSDRKNASHKAAYQAGVSVSYKRQTRVGGLFLSKVHLKLRLCKRCAGKEFKRENMVNTIYELAWIFFIYSFIGWCGEVIVAAVNRHKFVNRGLSRDRSARSTERGSGGGGVFCRN